MNDNEPIWSRWGNPLELPKKYPSIHYVFLSNSENSLINIPIPILIVFSVSTLEHIPNAKLVDVFKDMHRCLKRRLAIAYD
jgi:hypothetical protein